MASDRDRKEDDLKEEIAFHLAAETERRIAAGLTPDRARVSARRAFGNVPLVENVTRNMWGPMMIRERLLHDIRFAARLLVRDPSFTTVAVATLSLGIAAAITVFAVLKAVLLNPLPFPGSDRLMMVWERTPNGDERNMVRAYNVMAWRARNQSLEQIAGIQPLPMNVSGIGDAEQVDGLGTVGGFFEAMAVPALLGRTYAAGEAGKVVVSYGFWQRRLGGRPDVIGRPLTLNGVSREVVGVMPDGFAFPTVRAAQLYVAIPFDPTARPGGRNMFTVARLKRGVTLEAARADMRRVVAQLIQEGSPGVSSGWSATVFPLLEETVQSVRRVLWVILVAVACLLLLACANVANLLLIRASKRAHEIAVRVALGAGRWRLAHQMAAESALLLIIAGAVGLGTAVIVVPAIPTLFPDTFPLPRATEVTIDRSVVAYTLLLCGAIALVFSLFPLLRVTRERVAGFLQSGSRSAFATHSRLRRGLVVAEVTIALVLVLAAALMGRSLVELTNVEPGFKADHVLTLRMLMTPSKYGQRPAMVSFLKTVLEETRATPNVISASSIHFLPLSGAASTSPIFRADQPQPPREQLQGFPISIVSDNYFRTMGIPLEGRDFNASDGLGTPGVAVVNASLARRLFPNENPIGKRVTAMYSPNTEGLEIVGIAGDVRTSTIDREPGPALYIAHTQEPSLLATLVVRTPGEPSAAVAAVRAAIARADPDQGVSRVQALDSVIAGATARPRVQAAVFVMFGVLALIIAAVGLYGVTAYGVEQRRREIGLRIALGASPRRVLRTVVHEGVLLAAIGTAIGAALAWMSSGALEGLLYQIRPTDPWMFVTAAVALIAVACLATLAPALRATRVDPLVVLREE